MKRDSPCKHCTKRELGCHSTCKEYSDFRILIDAEREITSQKLKEERYFADRNASFEDANSRRIKCGFKRIERKY